MLVNREDVALVSEDKINTIQSIVSQSPDKDEAVRKFIDQVPTNRLRKLDDKDIRWRS